MTILLVGCWIAFSSGVWVLLVGRRQPSVAEELALLGGTAPPSGFVESVGNWAAELWAKAGGRSVALEADLALVRISVGKYYGEKVAGGVLALLWIPLLRLFGVHISFGPAAFWSLALASAGFFAPNLARRNKARAAREELRNGVAEIAVLMSLAVSAGVGIDAAFRGALQAGPGRFAEELVQARNELPRETVRRVIDSVANRLGLPEAANLASVIGASEYGASVSDALDELAWSMVETRRVDAIREGRRAQARGVVLASGLMLPGYLVLMGFPPVRLAVRALLGF